MKVSIEWIRSLNNKYGCSADPMPNGVKELVEKIGLQLGQVDAVENLGKKYEDVLVAKVESVNKHPNADKLSICLIDDGSKNKNVKRDKNGLIQVVCGAPNVKAGQLVAWIPPGSTVPSSFDKQLFVIEAREIRGVLSNGMIASAKELDIGDEHDGILILDQPAKPGQLFMEVYGLNDYIVDIENKMFTHRPDLFGQLGLARELAGIQHQTFKSPDWYKKDVSIRLDGRSNGLKITVKNQVPHLVPRFSAIAIKDIKVAPSPIWLQSMLSRVDIKPINNVVDLTNYLMMETAQPLHAYDYDKVKTATLGVRLSKKGEKLKLIGGKEIILAEGAIVITDGQKPVGLGGVMGGADTEVDSQTKNIILEAANFDMNRTRKTAMRYGLFTDAATRFTKNQSPRQSLAVISQAINDIKRMAGGRVASKVIDLKHDINQNPNIKLTSGFINARLGTNLSVKEIKQLFTNIEFDVQSELENISVTAPFWRTDIAIKEDIVEEVGRLYGYQHLPLKLPQRDLEPVDISTDLAFKFKIKQILTRTGANEVLTYSFVHDRLLKKNNQDLHEAYRIRNALSPDLKYYRLSLLPNLLEKISSNIRNGYNNFGLFEAGKAHIKNELDSEKLPKEFERLALVFASKDKVKDAAYYEAKYILEFLGKQLGSGGFSYKPLDKKILGKIWDQAYRPFESVRSSGVFYDDNLVGIIGEPTQAVRQNLKLPSRVAMFELDTGKLQAVQKEPAYKPLNKYPFIEQDISLKLKPNISYASISSLLEAFFDQEVHKHNYIYTIEPLDIYQPGPGYKHISWRINMGHPDRTLTTEETNNLLNNLAEMAKAKYNALRI